MNPLTTAGLKQGLAQPTNWSHRVSWLSFLISLSSLFLSFPPTVWPPFHPHTSYLPKDFKTKLEKP